jgi:2-methylcitrate dehydratase PrpD
MRRTMRPFVQSQPLPGASALLLRDAYLKPFAAVRHVHYGATAARNLREQRGRH